MATPSKSYSLSSEPEYVLLMPDDLLHRWCLYMFLSLLISLRACRTSVGHLAPGTLKEPIGQLT